MVFNSGPYCKDSINRGIDFNSLRDCLYNIYYILFRIKKQIMLIICHTEYRCLPTIVVVVVVLLFNRQARFIDTL